MCEIDIDVGLGVWVIIVNQVKVDFFLSVYFNLVGSDMKMKGVEVFMFVF